MNDEQRGVYSPAVDDEEFDARYDSGTRGVWLLAGSVVILLALSIFLWRAYAGGTRARGEPPRILAETEPYKVTPDDPGGAQTPNQDKEVYDILGGASDGDDDVTVQPGAEDPILPDETETPDRVTINVNGGDDAPTTREPEPDPEPVDTTPAPATQPATQPAVSGGYVVQVASFGSRADAETEWGNLTSRLPSIVSSVYARDIQQAEVNGRTVYRLRVAAFDSRSAAQSFCDRLQAAGQGCFVQSR